MWLFNLFKRKNRPKVNITAEIRANDEINPIYKEFLDNGLLPGELVLLDWIDGKSIDAKFPGYFEHTYGIDARTSATKLINDGFLIPAPPQKTLTSLKLTELKEILKDNNLKVSGKKSELIKRLSDSLLDEDIMSYITNKTYTISSKGKLALDKYYYVVPAHKNGSKDNVYNVASAIKFIRNNDLKFTPGNRDISWALFQQDYLKNHQSQMYGLARNNMLAMAKQLEQEGNLELSLKYYLNVCIMDLSGLSNNGRLNTPNLVYFPFSVIEYIKSILNELNIDDKVIHNVFTESWNETRQSIPFHYISENECFDCVIRILKGIDRDNGYVQTMIQNKFNELDKKRFEEEYNLSLPFLGWD